MTTDDEHLSPPIGLSRLVFLCVVLIFTGCIPSGGVSGEGETYSQTELTPAVTDLHNLEAESWVLVSFTSPDRPLSVPSILAPTLRFENGTYTFDAGCNPVSGDYTITSESLTIKTVAMHLVDCTGEPGGPEAMALETAMADSLDTWSISSLTSDELHIEFEGGEMIFRRGST